MISKEKKQKRPFLPPAIRVKPPPNPSVRKILPSPVERLHRTLGNQGYRHYFRSVPKFGLPDDKFEQEADRIAYQMANLPESQAGPQQEKDAENQHRAAKAYGQQTVLTTDLESQIRSHCRNGRPLSRAERSFFEPRFGVDFSGVRIHTDHSSKRIAESINARAFTLGNDIYFASVSHDFTNSAGRTLIAHELTHTIQQDQKNTGLSRPSEMSASKTTQPVKNTSGTMIQRWGLNDHKTLTEQAVNKFMPFFPEVTVDGETVEALKNYSTEMDRRLPAICFNLNAVLIGSHEALTEHYQSNRFEAENHGEGGLYMHDMPTARGINLSRQTEYEDKARRAWRTTQGTFGSISDCFAAKASGGWKTLEALGYALHVAQDRGAHGEGAIGQGHDRQDFSPDDPSVNTQGWRQAQNNTEIVILNAMDILYKLLDERWSRTCSSTSPAEVGNY